MIKKSDEQMPVEVKDILSKYIAFRGDPTNEAYDDARFCSDHSISLAQLREYKLAWPEWATQFLQRKRQLSIERLSNVDDGLFRKAECGDVKAAELLYERLEGYVRPSKAPIINVGLQVNLAEAVRDAHRRGNDADAIDAEGSVDGASDVAEGPSSV